MKPLSWIVVFVFAMSCTAGREPTLPVSSGTYQFNHRDAEFPHQPGFPVMVTISGFGFTVGVQNPSHPGEICELYQGTLMWNGNVQKWVLGTDEADRSARQAGGCQDNGPDAIDFKQRIVWTCVSGAVVTDACAHQGR
jgi:hypothetical protein